MTRKTIGHLISHTHWDREWRVPEWHSRWRLEVMMEKLLDTMPGNPDFIFLFDGQVAGILDYLEMHPEMREEVESLVKDGRLQAGPWYNLPDLYPVCGEALVRNLLTGIREANKLGKCLMIGYTTFGWGQTAQFPQLFKRFGIDQVVGSKNVSKKRAPHSEFFWEAPDGSSVFATRLGKEKRANFFFSAIMPALYGHSYSDDEMKVSWGKEGWFFHSSDAHTDSEHTFIPETTFHPEIIEKAIEDTWDTCKESLVGDHLFMGNGCDSTAPDDVVDRIVAYVNTKIDDKELIYSDLGTYLKLVRQTIKDRNIELKTVYGELRDGPVHAVSGNALATRMPIKRENRKAQDQLIHYAEPFAVWAGMLGAGYPDQYLEKAWQFLLLAHSHDAINGVTLDKTADDTVFKLRQVQEISQVVMDKSAMEILKRVDLSSFDDDDILLALFNPSAQPKSQVIRVVIDIPEEKRCRRLRVYDTDNSELHVQNLAHSHHAAPVNVQNSRALPFYCDRHTLDISTGEIPACGYKILKVVPDDFYNDKVLFWQATYEHGSQLTGPLTMENSYLRVTLNGDGTYNIHDKQSQQDYNDLGYYEDSGDVGDYWQRVRPQYDKIIFSKGKTAEIYLKEDGPLFTVFESRIALEVPAQAEKQPRFASRRSDSQSTVAIITEYRLRADSSYLEVKVSVDNRARDHRLRVSLPTNLATDVSHAMGHFNVDTRTVMRDYTSGIRDGEMGTLPMQRFVDLSDGEKGLGILNRELIEFEVSEDKSRTVSLTLLRCMDVNISTEVRCRTIESGAEGSQCLGKNEFHYAVYPHRGNWTNAGLYAMTDKYLYQPRAYQISKHHNGSLPCELSLISVDSPDIQMASIKKALHGNSYIVRLYNPTPVTQKGRLRVAGELHRVWVTNLNEMRENELHVENMNSVFLTILPCQITTIEIDASYK